MRWVYLPSLLIGILLTICVSTARQLGQGTPLPESIQSIGLHPPELCGGNGVCLLGITPGSTGWNAARSMLLPRSRDELYTKQLVISVDTLPNQVDETLIYFFQSVDTLSVGRIQALFRVREAAPNVGWLIKQHGAPCGVSLYTRTASGYRLPQATITLRYPHFLANVPLPNYHLDISTRIESLYLYDPAYKAEVRLEACRDLMTDGVQNRRWRGFAAVWRYAALARY
ncbi:MAG: hypothetical protein DYG88_00545 [Chloroflexi bacterium CFX4]|nr:hypothetical protein [Chloroflexi bacterium CFX4]MDL1921612.1 hypothetical protein [Chloroflexi bacterium CFX3]